MDSRYSPRELPESPSSLKPPSFPGITGATRANSGAQGGDTIGPCPPCKKGFRRTPFPISDVSVVGPNADYLPLAAFLREAALSVFSQVNSLVSRPKWPPAAVL